MTTFYHYLTCQYPITCHRDFMSPPPSSRYAMEQICGLAPSFIECYLDDPEAKVESWLAPGAPHELIVKIETRRSQAQVAAAVESLCEQDRVRLRARLPALLCTKERAEILQRKSPRG